MDHKMVEKLAKNLQKSSLHLHLLTDPAQVELSRDTIYNVQKTSRRTAEGAGAGGEVAEGADRPLRGR
jgi:hypothetical protein